MRIKTNCLNEITPIFFWILEDCTDQKQISYNVTVCSAHGDVVWSSGTVDSDCSTGIPYQGHTLKENTKYLWNVTITTEKAQYTSEEAFFITALQHFDDLIWVSPAPGINAPMIHKEFELDQVCDYALLNLCGLGYFEVYLNGRKVSDELMNPVRTDYDNVEYRDIVSTYTGTTRKTLKYLSYEVSEYLKAGKNKITVWLGNGWYRQNGRTRTVEGKFYYGDLLKLFFRLVNGDEVILSDEDCYCTDSPIVYDNIFYGEVYDARISGNIAYPVSVVEAPAGTLTLQLCPPERIRQTYIPSVVKESGTENTQDGIKKNVHNNGKKIVYDTGICLTGFAQITCSGNMGDEITISYAEDLDENGALNYTSTVGYVESDKDQIQSDKFILSGQGDETYAPRFVWHAFRYFQISAPTHVKIKDVKVHYVCTDVVPRTRLECSNELLNQIHQMSLNTQLTNTHGCTPMDCPHRERLGYTGDGQLSSLSMMTNFHAHDMYTKWVNDIFDAQDPENGFVPHTAPFNGGGGGPGWGSAVAIVPWNMYQQYGDRQILQKARPHIRKWLQYLNQCRENGFVTHEQSGGGDWCLGEWCMPSPHPWSDPFLHDIRIPSILVNTVYFIHCADIYQRISKMFDLEVEPWITKERNISVDAVNTLLKENHYADGEQGSNLFPLYAGIVPKEQEMQVLENTIQRIVMNNYRFETGLSGTCFTFRVLDRYDRNDIALKMMLGTEYPSFGNMIKHGATSLWETWEGNGSKNHTAFSSADAWFTFGLAGIKPQGGYKEFTLKPYFAPELSHLKFSLDSEYGEISLHWVRTPKGIEVEFTVPFNTIAHVNLNGKCFDATPGIYKELLYSNEIRTD